MSIVLIIRIGCSQDCKLQFYHTQEEIEFAQFSPNGEIIYIDAPDIETNYYEPETFELVKTIRPRYSGLWSVNTGKLIHKLSGHYNGKSDLFSPDGNLIITSTWDDSSFVWDVNSGKPVRSLVVKGGKIQFGPDGKSIFFENEEGTHIIHNLGDTNATHLDGVFEGISPDGTIIATSSNNSSTVKIWEYTTGRLLFQFEAISEGRVPIIFSPNSKKLLSLPNASNAQFWDISSGKLVHTFESIGLTAYCPESQTLVTVTYSESMEIKIWDVTSGNYIRSLKGTPETINSIEFSKDGTNILIRDANDSFSIFEAATGHLVHSIETNQWGIDYWQYSSKEDKIIGVKTLADKDSTPVDFFALDQDSIEREVYILDSKSGKLTNKLDGVYGRIQSISFSSDGQKIAIASNGGITFWNSSDSVQMLDCFLIDGDPLSWIHIQKNGHFDASEEAMKELSLNCKSDLLEFGKFKEQFYQPNLWEKVMKSE